MPTFPYFESLKSLLARRLVRTTGIYTLSSVANSAVPFLLIPVFTRYLTPHDYGVLALMMAVLGFVSPLVSLSLAGGYVAAHYREPPAVSQQFLAWALWFPCIAGTFLSLTGWVSFPLWSGMSPGLSASKGWILLLPLYSAVVLFSSTYTQRLQAHQRPVAFFAFQISQTVVIASLSLIFIIPYEGGWQGRLLAMWVGQSLFALVVVGLLWRERCLSRPRFVGTVKALFGFGLRLFPHAFSSPMMGLADRFVLAHALGAAVTGQYALAMQVGMIIEMVGSSFGQAWTPYLFEKLKTNSKASRMRVAQATALAVSLWIVLGIASALVIPMLFPWLVGKKFQSAGSLIPWACLTSTFGAIYHVFVGHLFYYGKTGRLSAASFGSGVVKIVLAYVLVGPFGATGIAVSGCIASGLLVCAVVAMSGRISPLPWRAAIGSSWGGLR